MQGMAAFRTQFAILMRKTSVDVQLRASAHILGRAVLSQMKPAMQPCIQIHSKDDDRRALLKPSLKYLSEKVCIKKAEMNDKKQKQAFIWGSVPLEYHEYS